MLTGSPLNTGDRDHWSGGVPPGAPAVDAPVQHNGAEDWLLRHLATGQFTQLRFEPPVVGAASPTVFVTATPCPGALHDAHGLAAARYDAQPGTTILLRPDQHVAGRWRQHDPARLRQAMETARAC